MPRANEQQPAALLWPNKLCGSSAAQLHSLHFSLSHTATGFPQLAWVHLRLCSQDRTRLSMYYMHFSLLPAPDSLAVLRAPGRQLLVRI